MRNLNKKVFKRLEKVCVSYKFLNDDVCYFYGISWKDYYDKFDDVRDIVSIDYDSKYMNRKGYNIIMVSNKEIYGNKNMDKLFRNELFGILDSEGFDEMLVSDIENNYFDNKSLFGLLYNFRSSRWSVNSYSDRFEMWCRRSGLLEKRKISKNSSYNRRWIIKKSRFRDSKDMSVI
jgi:hypothetical protein